MKVKKLIKMLEKIDPDAEVCIKNHTLSATPLAHVYPDVGYTLPDFGVYFFTTKKRKEYTKLAVFVTQ